MYHSAILKSWWWRWLRLESVSSLNFSKTFYFLSKCLITRSILDILTSVCFVILSNKSTWYALFYNFLITDVSLKHLCYLSLMVSLQKIVRITYILLELVIKLNWIFVKTNRIFRFHQILYLALQITLDNRNTLKTCFTFNVIKTSNQRFELQFMKYLRIVYCVLSTNLR